MATYSRTNSNTTTSTTSQLPSTNVVRQNTAQMGSKELGDILIRSLETVTEALSGDDVPVGYKEIEKAVTTGINKSVLVKGGKSSGGTVQGGSKSDAALSDYWRQKQYLEWKKEQQRQAKLDDEDRKRRNEQWDKKVDEAFQSINQFSNNPLKGFSDALDKGVKGLFKGINVTMNKSLGEIGTDLKKGFGTVMAPAKTMGTIVGGAAKGIGNAAIYGAAGIGAIKDRMRGGPAGSSDTSMEALLEDDEEEQAEKEKEAQEVQEEQTEKMGELVEGQKKAETMSTLKLGIIITSIAGVAAAIPAIAGAILPVINNIPMYLKDTGVKVAALVKGPNSIMNQIKLAIEASLAKLSSSSNPILSSIGKTFASGASAETLAARDSAADNYMQKLLDQGLDEKTASALAYKMKNQTSETDAAYSMFDDTTFAEGFDEFRKANKNIKKSPYYKKAMGLINAATADEIRANWLTDAELQALAGAMTSTGLSADKVSNIIQGLKAKRAAVGVIEAVKAVENDKDSLRDFDAEKRAMQERGAEYEQNEKAEWRLEKLKSGELSMADLVTDKEWQNNETLIAAIQGQPELLKNLKGNSKMEDRALAGMDYNSAWGKTLKDALHDVFGYDIKDKDNSLNIKMQTPVMGALGGV